MRDLLDPKISTLSESRTSDLVRTALVTTGGFALYGFTVGFWRSPVMGVYVAIKMPMLIACVLGCNGLLNGLLGILLGSNLGFKQSLQSLLSAFSISALILGSIAPVTFFLALNAPPPDSPQAGMSHAGYMLSHTLLIALAGCIGVMRLSKLLNEWCPSRKIALSTLTAWIAGNAFIGAQFSYIFRPFFGNPNLEVAFLREHPMKGSFYEVIFRSISQLMSSLDPALIIPMAICIPVFAVITGGVIHNHRKLKSNPTN